MVAMSQSNWEKYKSELTMDDIAEIVKAMMTPHDAWVALEEKNWEKWGNEDNFRKWTEVGNGPAGSGRWKSEWYGLGAEKED